MDEFERKVKLVWKQWYMLRMRILWTVTNKKLAKSMDRNCGDSFLLFLVIFIYHTIPLSDRARARKSFFFRPQESEILL